MVMKIALYTLDEWEHVCPVIRVINPAKRNGFEVLRGCRWQGDEQVCSLEEVAKADVIVIQRDFPRRLDLYERVLEAARAEGKPIIYEIDDWLLEIPPRHPDFARYRPARIPMLDAIMNADVVTCPSPVLAEYLCRFNERVAVLPNYLDDQVWQKAILNPPSIEKGDGDRPLVIGYMGGHSHIADLEWIKPVLVEILRKYGERVKIRFVGFCGQAPLGTTEGWKNVEWTEVGFIDYAEFAEYFSNQSFDFFIAPLADSLFNRAKSSIKFLEYSILGVPGVYSRVPPFERVVVHGENGFLAANLKEWREYIERLVEDLPLRTEMGQKARKTVLEHWLLSDHAHEWREVYEQAVSLGIAKASKLVRGISFSTKSLQKWDKHSLQLIKNFREQLDNCWEEIHFLEKQLAERDHLLNEILTSPGWKLVNILGAVRMRLAPQGSKRERLFFSAMAFLSRVMSTLLKAKSQTKHPSPEVGTLQSASPGTSFSKQRQDFPLLSIMLEEGYGVDAESVKEWVALQTHPVAEIVVWDRKAAKARRIAPVDDSWPAPTLGHLKQGLWGKYVGVASLNMIQLPETCLEDNLIALEGENLVFTVNWGGNPAKIRPWLRSGSIPQVFGTPCFYITRKECLGEDLSIRLEKVGRNDIPMKVGKIITHHQGKECHRYEMAELLPGPSICADKPELLDVRGYDIILRPWERTNVESEPGQPRSLTNSIVPYPIRDDGKPRVLVVMPFLAVGGAERVALEVMYRLKDDIRFAMITVEGHSPQLGSMVHLFRQVTPYVFTALDWLAPELRFSFFEYVLEKTSPRTLYIANGSGWIYDVLGYIKKRFPDLRVVNQVYDHRIGWINRYDAELVRLIDAHIGCNEKICRAYEERGVPPEHIHLIGHGIDTLQFDPSLYPEERRRAIKEQMGLPVGNVVVTFMGRLHPQKRPMDFVELARRFVNDPALTFLMVGDGPLAGVVDSVLQRVKLRNFIRRPFLKATDVLAISDVVVLPSEYEGMPMVILEAQSMGKPVVVTDVGNAKEIIETTGGGVIIGSIGDVNALAEGVKAMLENPPDPVRVREAVVANFDVRKIAHAYKQALLGEG